MSSVRMSVGLRAAMAVASLAAFSACATTAPRKAEPSFQQTGVASYYAKSLDGRRTASGEKYDRQAMTAAHRTLPFGSRVRVTNLSNSRSVVVRINDRGPFVEKRVIDLSYAAARELQFIEKGIAKVRLEVLGQ